MKKYAGVKRCNGIASMKKNIGFLQIKIVLMLHCTGYLKPPILIIVSFKSELAKNMTS